jgi:O-antigen/teichoic acid export membrane protein
VALLKQLTINSTINLLGVIVPVIVTYFLTPYLLRELGDYRFGVWASINSFFGYFLLLDMGMGGAIRRFIAQAIGRKDDVEIRNVLANAIYFYFVMALLVAALGIASLHFLTNSVLDLSLTDIEILTTSYLIILFIALTLLSQTFSGALIAYQRFDIQVSARTGQLLLQTALILAVFEFAEWKSLEAIAISYVFSGLAVLIAVVASVNIFCVRLRTLSGRFNSFLLKKLFSFGWMSSITGVGDIVVTNSGAVLIAMTIGPEEVVHYAVPLAVATMLPRLIAVVTQAVSPEVGRLSGSQDVSKIKTIYYHLSVLINCVCVPAWFVSVSLASEFFSLWVGQGRSDYTAVYLVCATATAMRAMQSTSYQILMSAGRILAQSLATIAAAAIGVVLAYILLSKGWGIVYGVGALLFPSAIRDGIVMPLSVCRQFKIPAIRLYFRGYVIPIIISGCVTFLMAFIKEKLIFESMVKLILFGGVGFFASVSISILLSDRFFMNSILKTLWSRIGNKTHA